MAASGTSTRVDQIRVKVQGLDRINVTELARGNDWRRRLPECDVMEITDRGESAGWLVSTEGMGAILETIDALERQLEQTQIAAIANARSGYENWLSGGELVAAALEEYKKSGDAIEAVIENGS